MNADSDNLEVLAFVVAVVAIVVFAMGVDRGWWL